MVVRCCSEKTNKRKGGWKAKKANGLLTTLVHRGLSLETRPRGHKDDGRREGQPPRVSGAEAIGGLMSACPLMVLVPALHVDFDTKKGGEMERMPGTRA